MIWLVDYTHYNRDIDLRLQQYRRDYFTIKNYKRFHSIGPTAPVKTRVFSTGLLRLATILDRNGIQVRFLHYYMLEQLLEQNHPLPETVAFSCVCPTVSMCAALGRKIKEKSPGTQILVGGSHINIAPLETQKRYPIFDKLVVGYEHDAAEQIAGVPLKAFTDKYVDYHLLPYPLSDYAINTFTAMGCLFSCDYCVDGLAPHFCASPNGQLDDMMQLLPPKTLIHFFDSALGYSHDGLKQVCRSIREVGHDFLLSCDMRADLMSPEAVRYLTNAGFVELRMGMESADSGLLHRNGRTLLYQKFLDKLKMIRDEGNFYISLYTITGLPGTTRAIQEHTLDECDYLLCSGLVDEIKNTLYVPYPMDGVNYADRGVSILQDDWFCFDRQSYPVYRTSELSSEELWELYLHTARRINQSWLKSLGFDTLDQVPVIDDYYSEYVAANYLNNNTKRG